MKKDIEWLKKEIEEYLEYEGVRYSRMALESVLGYIDQLDEPEKVVIPKFVADYIELNKGWSEDRQEYIEDDSSGLWFALDGNSYGMPNSVSDWLFNEEKVETFAKAWLDGFTIANEDKQEVEENFYTFDNAKKWLHDNGFVVFEKDKLDEEVQRMIEKTYKEMNEKPIIPEYVADWIDAHNLYGNNPLREYRDLENDFNEGWTDEKDAEVYHWVNKNPYAFIDALRYGCEVEEEKNYRVVFPYKGETVYLKESVHGDFDVIETETYGTQYTEAEIKAIDERFWAFAQEVTK